MDRNTLREKFDKAAAGTSVLALAAAGMGAVVHYSLTDPAEAFERRYAAEAKCLAESPYDRDAGALYIRDRTLFADAELTVVPERANDNNPSVLQFYAETSLGRVVLYADGATAEYLAVECVSKAEVNGDTGIGDGAPKVEPAG